MPSDIIETLSAKNIATRTQFGKLVLGPNRGGGVRLGWLASDSRTESI
jgi:hypothetical protein